MKESHPFGDALTTLRARKHGLSQARLAELAGYDPAVIARMGQGQRDLTGPQGRDRVIRVIQALQEAGVLYSIDEANGLLGAAEMPPLYAGNAAEAVLLQRLTLKRKAIPLLDLQTPLTPRHNLPAQLTSFVGRQQEIAQVRQFLAAPTLVPQTKPQARLVTLTGPGGVGKTRLALEIARPMVDDFSDGVWWVSLGALADPSLIAQRILEALALSGTTSGAVLGVLVSHLETRRMLLILDNCEHLVNECAELVAHLMGYCPGLRFLATSRESLQVPGELALRVPPLDAPRPLSSHASANAPAPSSSELTVQEALGFDAVRLFVERAQAMRPKFGLNASNAAAVIHICDRLDGIPLAIELATTLLQVMSVEEIAARIDQRFALLRGGYRTATARHQALSNAVDWSYELLTPVEQALLARLSVFVGGWAVHAAEAICANVEPEDVLTREAVLPALRQLVNKSLVVIDQPDAGITRYRLLKTIHEYAAIKLREAERDNALRDRHLNHFLQRAEAADAQLMTRQHVLAINWLSVEQDNLRAALAQAEMHGGEPLLRLVAALQTFWSLRYQAEEASTWLAKALRYNSTEHLHWRLGALYAADWDMPVPLDTDESQLNRDLEACRKAQDKQGVAWALFILGMHARFVKNDFALSMGYYADALASFEAMGDLKAVDRVRTWAGVTISDDPSAYEEWTLESLRRARAAHEPWGECLSLLYMANFAGYKLKDSGRAIEYGRAALEIAQTIAEPWLVIWANNQVGRSYIQHGEAAQAAQHFRNALQQSCAMDIREHIYMLSSYIAEVDAVGAFETIQSYLRDKQQAGDKQGIACGLYALGLVAQDGLHDFELSRQLIEQSLAIWRELQIVHLVYGGVTRTLVNLGQAHRFLGNLKQALACYDECLQLCDLRNSSFFLPALHLFRGYTQLALDDLTDAAKEFRIAWDVVPSWGDLSATLAMTALGEVAWRRGDKALSAKLSGCGATQADMIRNYMYNMRVDYERLIAAARERLSDPDYADAWALGEKLSVDEVKALWVS